MMIKLILYLYKYYDNIYILHLKIERSRASTIRRRKIDDSIVKRVFMKIYHQSGVKVDNENSNIKFFSGDNHNFVQVGDGYLEFDIKIRKADNSNFTIVAHGNDVIRLINDAFAYIFHDARISISSGVENEQNKYVGPISTIMLRLVTRKDGDLSTYYDTIDESEDGINGSSLKQILIKYHTDDNRGSITGHLPLEYIFAFANSSKN